MIAIVNYGLGNVQAFANIYKRLDVPTVLATEPAQLADADRIILPGVGAFDWAMTRLESSGLRAALDAAVMEAGKPVLGICVGMQMLASRSEEGTRPGLGWIDGDVRKFDVAAFEHRTRLPHMGWNDVRPCGETRLFSGLESDARFYFLHSYYFAAAAAADVLAEADYNGAFAASVGAKNIYGVQFHPEKSHQWGIRLLRNFAEL